MKLFLWAFYVGFIFFSLNVPGQTGKYSEAFESEVTYNKCYNLTCTLQPTSHAYTSQAEVEVGHSIGPLGKTTHYAKTPITTTHIDWNGDWKCTRCGAYSMRHSSPPNVTFQQKGDTRVMKINEKFNPLKHICSKPNLNGDLEVIWKASDCNYYNYNMKWDKALESMWEAARRLDEEEDSVGESDEILPKLEKNYIIENSSCCCIIF